MIRAKIQKLEIRGFRRFQGLTKFKFEVPGKDEPPNTLVIAGPNGSGKSTFFEAILYALGRDDLIHRELRGSNRDQWFMEAVAADGEVRLELQIGEAQGTILGQYGPSHIEVRRSPDKWVLRIVGKSNDAVSREDELRRLFAQIPVEWFSSWRQPYLCGAVPPMWQLPNETAHGEARRLWEIKQRTIDERTRSAISRKGEPGKDIGWLEKLNAAWAALHGADGTRLNMDVGRDGKSFDLILERHYEGTGWVRICSVDQLSSGELEWLTLAGTLITSDFEANENDGMPGIVLIDEPELHLHYEWQAPLLAALRTVVPQSQLFLATHADPPWDQVYTFERVLLPPDDPRGEST
ncbi:MAG TPA: AAA family ATPase [Polyangium sp.]|nr:AAA family ATPase [Polyangium sp.]